MSNSIGAALFLMRPRAGNVRPLLRLCACCAVLLVCALAPRSASATISYTISLNHPEQHLFHVTMSIPVEGREVTTALPAWNALYQIRNFAERVRDVSANCQSLTEVPLAVRKSDKDDWQIYSPGQCAPGDHNTFIIEYTIFWDDPGPFDSQLNAHHAFVNPAEILMYIPTRRAESVELRIADLPPGWTIGTSIQSGHAASYDQLADAPIEIGSLNQLHYESDGVPIRILVDGKDSDAVRLETYLRRITDYELQMMGPPSFDSPDHDYTFLFIIGPAGDNGGGGMEHRNSCAIAGSSVEEVAAVAAHEFFHAWNVKRIRPQSLEPVDYSREQYTRALWFAEGVTSTYASYTLERTGLWTKNQFYRDLSGQIAMLQSRPAHLWQSAEESSLDAWFEGFNEYRDQARSISYYNKGQILGVMLDLAIRDATDNHKSLDDVMRRMNAEYAAKGKFYDDSEGVRAVIEEVSGKDFKDFFARYVAGTDEIPYDKFFSVAGLALSSDSRGGAPQFPITEIAHPTDRQRRILDGLLHGTTD
jgi:predicted metalloprotease with PDZ domain